MNNSLTCTSTASETCWRCLRWTCCRCEFALRGPGAVSPSGPSVRFPGPASPRPHGLHWWRAAAWRGRAPAELWKPEHQNTEEETNSLRFQPNCIKTGIKKANDGDEWKTRTHQRHDRAVCCLQTTARSLCLYAAALRLCFRYDCLWCWRYTSRPVSQLTLLLWSAVFFFVVPLLDPPVRSRFIVLDWFKKTCRNRFEKSVLIWIQTFWSFVLLVHIPVRISHFDDWGDTYQKVWQPFSRVCEIRTLHPAYLAKKMLFDLKGRELMMWKLATNSFHWTRGDFSNSNPS